ncbi:MAG: polysaccharide deacetylase family protein, partial [Lachnospiraceae bacterium]|nr:polysaccharide deacetylase family protein [Lachnospiraceae bacterium]
MLKSEADEGLSQLNQEKANRDLETKELLAEPEEPLIQEIDEALPGKKVYLTFDDGPSPNTEKILDILDEYDVKATFFVTGYQAEKHPEWYKEIVDRGHTIGMHSYSHVYSDIYSSTDAFFADIDKLHDYIL